MRPILIHRFMADRGGAIALVAAIALAPLIGLAAAAIDFSSLARDKAILQRAADAAALAAARADRDGADPEVIAKRAFEALIGSEKGLVVQSVRHAASDGVHRVDADARRPSAFAGILPSAGHLSARADAGFVRERRPAEVAFVVDTTASMNFGTRWSDATGTIAEGLRLLRERDPERFRASLVPFADRVRVTDLPAHESWLDRPAPSDWTGCVEPREFVLPDFPHAVDARFADENGFRFVPTHHDVPSPLAPEQHPYPVCPGVGATPPTNQITVLENALRRLVPGGTGRFEEGLVWGWRMITPRWARAMGVTPPVGELEPERLVVFVTDGNSTIYEWEVGGWNGGHYGWNNGSPMGFRHLLDLCRRMHADGVRIVMMRLPGNPHFEDYARRCASSAEDYFFVDGIASLRVALEKVGDSQGSGVRLLR